MQLQSASLQASQYFSSHNSMAIVSAVNLQVPEISFVFKCAAMIMGENISKAAHQPKLKVKMASDIVQTGLHISFWCLGS